MKFITEPIGPLPHSKSILTFDFIVRDDQTCFAHDLTVEECVLVEGELLLI